ncbi:MAG: hypothetical protein HC802_19875 [Caldilineaceae bacterium]|nr:hypothetical protein [Caldilineaceae bacterium]
MWIRLGADVETLTYEVEDDGIGFDFAATIENYYEAGSYGLLNMHERVSILSGSLSVLSPCPATNNGVLIRGSLPRKQVEKQPDPEAKQSWAT